MSDRLRLGLTSCGVPDHLHLSLSIGSMMLTTPVTDQELRPIYDYLRARYESAPSAPSVGGPPDSRQGPEATSAAGCPDCGHKTMQHGLGGCYHVDELGEICTCSHSAAEIVRVRRGGGR